MGFLAPSAFVIGAALLAALLASYLLRPRRPVRRVSSTFLWLAALHDRMHSARSLILVHRRQVFDDLRVRHGHH